MTYESYLNRQDALTDQHARINALARLLEWSSRGISALGPNVDLLRDAAWDLYVLLVHCAGPGDERRPTDPPNPHRGCVR